MYGLYAFAWSASGISRASPKRDKHTSNPHPTVQRAVLPDGDGTIQRVCLLEQASPGAPSLSQGSRALYGVGRVQDRKRSRCGQCAKGKASIRGQPGRRDAPEDQSPCATGQHTFINGPLLAAAFKLHPSLPEVTNQTADLTCAASFLQE
ncbi:hypothetical protein PENSPDRAFT_671977 [Peniophora sp. CONT]|nr:hypothetical protein PENSPDRAFT_671977 [Peniophora sp. CONT]